MSRVIVAGSPDFVLAMRRTGMEVLGETTTPQSLYPLVEQLSPDAVVLPAGRDWLEAASILAASRRNVKCFVSGDLGLTQWRSLRKSGCIPVSSDPAQASEEVTAATATSGAPVFQHDDRPIGVPELETEKVGMVRAGGMVAVAGIKGGIGKTEVSLNLAAFGGVWSANLLRSQGPEFKVCLLDFNSDYGTSKIHLGFYSQALDPSAQRVRSVKDWDDLALGARWEDVKERLNYYEPANLWYLAPPLAPEERVKFGADAASLILQLAGRHFDLVVIDLGTALDKRDQAMVALDLAKKILFVVEPLHIEVASAAEFAKSEIRGVMDVSKVSLVINQPRPGTKGKKPYTPAQVVRSIGIPYTGVIPYEPRIEDGRPHVCVDPKSPFSVAIREIARSLLGNASVDIVASRKGLLGRLFPKRAM